MKAVVLLDGSISNDARVMRQLNTVAEIAEVYLFSTEKEGFVRPMNLDLKININTVEYPNNLRQKLVRHTFINREYDFLFKEIQSSGEKYDICIANDLPTLRTGLLLKSKGIVTKLYYDAHEIYSETIKQFFPGIDSMSFLKRKISAFLTKLMVKNAVRFEKKSVQFLDGMMTVNNSLANYFSTNYSIEKPTIIRSIPDFKIQEDIMEFDFKQYYNWPEETKILIYQGMLNPGRGMELCIDTMRLLEDKYKLVVIGDGPSLEGLKVYTKNKNLTQKVKFHGSVPNNELIKYTLGADVGMCLIEPVNLSKKLSLPNKIFEYLHAGLPVVGSNIPEVRKIIQENKIGAVSDLDSSDLVIKINHVFKSDFSQNIHKAQKILSWSKEKEKLISLLKFK